MSLILVSSALHLVSSLEALQASHGLVIWALERLAQVCQHSADRGSTAQHSLPCDLQVFFKNWIDLHAPCCRPCTVTSHRGSERRFCRNSERTSSRSLWQQMWRLGVWTSPMWSWLYTTTCPTKLKASFTGTGPDWLPLFARWRCGADTARPCVPVSEPNDWLPLFARWRCGADTARPCV